MVQLHLWMLERPNLTTREASLSQQHFISYSLVFSILFERLTCLVAQISKLAVGMF